MIEDQIGRILAEPLVTQEVWKRAGDFSSEKGSAVE
jgi:hypothetical protein